MTGCSVGSQSMHRPSFAAHAICVLALAGIATSASARKAPRAVWQVSRTSDPITGASSCVVAAWDQAAGTSYSRTGSLYPFVENSSVHGLLVGVSSGGRMRLPTGDIVWRVDDRPFRTLTAANNPPGAAASAVPAGNPAMQQLVDQQMRIVAAATATSTVASGKTARAMLDELLAGKGLIFRSAATTTSYGLPNDSGQQVGLLTKDGVRPYPIDDSFRAGLAACGIANIT
ncbi:hypothetical protein [Sphingomonas sp. Leaf22]|uniref:hypothetical protein n=1 Tax=Sphingomonas sp. Leaf22 TaxID=1735687 RepID=UPI001F311012|nr:hypothetical protein [Sphingomonas sp. Leaf22]